MIARSPALLILLAGLAAAGAHAAPSYGERDDVRGFVAEMVERHGFEADRLLALFHKAHPDPAVIKAIQPPADPGSRSWRAYRDRFVEPRRIARGLDFWQRHAASLARAEATHGVPAAIVVAMKNSSTPSMP